MRLTVDQIMKQVAATVNQEANAPTTGGAEWSLWLQYINRGIAEWSGANDWEELRQTYYPVVIADGTPSVTVPLDFRKLAAPVRLFEGNLGIDYPEILSEEEGLKTPQVDKYLKVTGNTAIGFTLTFNPGTLASGASLQIQYFAMPTSLASPADYSPMQDPQFLVDRTVAYIFEARSDSRFQLEENKARERLLSMVEGHEMRKFNSYTGTNQVPDTLRRIGFRVGRD